MSSLTSQGLLYDIALSFVPGVGCNLSKQLISYCGSAEKVFQTPKGKLLKIPGVGEVLANSILSSQVMKEAERQLNLCDKNNIKIIPYSHPDFPKRLKNVYDAPSLLYFKGKGNLNTEKIIGIIGTRNATSYGKHFVENFTESILGRYPSLTIISGLAYGIDVQAHKAALIHQIPTIGVMGNGMDKIYPAAHKEIAHKMCEQGGLLTEYSLGTKADAHNFPARNRIVAGMCDAIIVVEAALKGGALITAEIANSYNTEVFAVPGNIGAKYSEGCNALIREHKANIFTNIEAFEKIMNWDQEHDSVSNNKIKSINTSALSEQQAQIIKSLQELGETQIDELSWKINIPMNKLAAELLNLEFEGYVQALPGKRFKLSH